MSGDKLSRPVVYVIRVTRVACVAKASNLHLEEAHLWLAALI
jgi:hypothetical protein